MTVKTLLLVDDEEMLRETIADTLELESYRVIQADCGESAVKVLETEDVDLVLSDMMMPNGNGAFVMESMRAKHYSKPALLFITGHSDLPLDETFHLGADGILKKPIKMNKLFEDIAALLLPYDERYAKPQELEVIDRLEIVMPEGVGLGDQNNFINVGRGGMFVRSDDPKALGFVEFSLNVQGRSVRGQGELCWVRAPGNNDDPGYGLKFIYLEDSGRQFLIDHLKGIQKSACIPLNLSV